MPAAARTRGKNAALNPESREERGGFIWDLRVVLCYRGSALQSGAHIADSALFGQNKPRIHTLA
jgi:hypothetical protein